MHALVGENGAGKSTALGIMAGRIAPTGGRVELFEQEIPYGDPRALRVAGVGAIYQELTIAPLLGVEANVFLGQPAARLGFLQRSDMRTRYVGLCAEFGVAAQPPGTLAGVLSVADQQLLEIMRALVRNCRVILFDEPTASLAVPEREAFYRLIRSLRGRGITIVFVSHNLDEVMMLADTITVFREGERRKTAPGGEWSKRTLVRTMLGEAADARVAGEMLEPDAPRASRLAGSGATRRASGGEPLLRAEGVTVPGAIEDISIEAPRGRDPRDRRACGLGAVDAAPRPRRSGAVGPRQAAGRRQGDQVAEHRTPWSRGGHRSTAGGSQERGSGDGDGGDGQHRPR